MKSNVRPNSNGMSGAVEYSPELRMDGSMTLGKPPESEKSLPEAKIGSRVCLRFKAFHHLQLVTRSLAPTLLDPCVPNPFRSQPRSAKPKRAEA